MNGYVLRWYSGYKKLGQAFVHKDSGLILFTYPGMVGPGKPPTGRAFIPKDKLRIINNAAEVDYNKGGSPSTERIPNRDKSI
ncbi:MAG TPA: hypothetical protein VE439_01695 [Anaerolineae bacterium]|nr:hypothetical protein [Anaerolineae bacterium]